MNELNKDMQNGEFYSITHSYDEISVISESRYSPTGKMSQWRFLKYSGSLDDEATGIVSSITQPLANAGISVFVNTTYDSGYFGVQQQDLIAATQALKKAGVIIE